MVLNERNKELETMFTAEVGRANENRKHSKVAMIVSPSISEK